MHKQNKNFNVEVMKSVDIIQHDQNPITVKNYFLQTSSVLWRKGPPGSPLWILLPLYPDHMSSEEKCD